MKKTDAQASELLSKQALSRRRLLMGSMGLVGYQSEDFYWHYLMKGIARSSFWVLINQRFNYCQ